MKLNYKKTLLIGLGFFTISIIWSIYNIQVPLYLKKFALPTSLIGLIMAIDNIFAVVFQPIFGALSDKTNNRYGRRMPYLLVGIPLTAVSFFLVPFASGYLPLLIITVICLNFFTSIYRAPAVALMPDLTPRPLRSKANGIINFMGGIGTALALIMAGSLFNYGEWYPFAIGALVLIASIIVLYNFVHEPERLEIEEKEQKAEGAKKEKGQTLSLIFLLLAIFFWFTGYSAIETFFSTYGEEILKIDNSNSSFIIAVVSVMFLLSAIPSGMIAGRFGRRKTIMAGLCLIIATFAILIFIRNITVMYFIFGLGGIFWALISINSYPMVVEMSPAGASGKYTGFYYFFSMLACIVSPVLYGFLKDLLWDGILFIYSALAMVFALFFMMLVKHGEAKIDTQGSSSVFEMLDN